MLEKGEGKNFAWPVSSVNKDDYERLIECVKSNIDIFKIRQIVIFGAGIRGTETSKILKENGFSNIIYIDNNKEKWGGYINEFPIVPPKEVLERYTEYVILVSVEKGLDIINELNKQGLIEGKDYFYPVTTSYELVEKEFFRECGPCTLIMGDCLFTKISFHDKNRMSLTDMLFENYGRKNTRVLAIPGFNMRSFYHLVQAELFRGSCIDKVILEINFDTMNGKQHMLPRVQHPELFSKIYEKIEGNIPEFEEYINVSKERAVNYQADFYTQFEKIGGYKERPENEMSRLYFMLHYMYELRKDNECLYFLEKLLSMLEAQHIKVIPFCPPVNYEYAAEIFGETFLQYYNGNLSILREVLQKRNIKLLDLSRLLTKNEFAEKYTSDETSNYYGRVCIANAILQYIEGRKREDV